MNRKEFSSWYRDKLNIEQKLKMKTILSYHKKIHNPQSNYVTLSAVNKMFEDMEKNFNYTFEALKIKLCDELLLKGLITDEDHKTVLSE